MLQKEGSIQGKGLFEVNSSKVLGAIILKSYLRKGVQLFGWANYSNRQLLFEKIR